jgi:hypothetical protein
VRGKFLTSFRGCPSGLTKRQLWAYSGLALKTSASGEYRFVEGQIKRSKKLIAIRGLNKNHNHDLKNIF